MPRRTRKPVAANDNTRQRNAGACKSIAHDRDILNASSSARQNISGFFTTLNDWMQAANDNAPTDVPVPPSNEASDES